MKNVKLLDGNIMPSVALGVFKSHEDTYEAVMAALKHGYRHIDTAACYHNEEDVGRAIKDSGIKREDIFVTTKLWNTDIRSGKCREAFELSLQKLQLDYVDLYLIHWPVEGYVEAFKEMVQLQKEGKIKSIGVSNFKQHHLEHLFQETGVVPVVDQVEYNPAMQDGALLAYCQKHQIALEAWSPLGRGAYLEMPEIVAIANKYQRSSAQIILRWLLQKGIVILPKSVHENRIIENIQLFDFTLSEADMQIMNGLNKNERMGPDPDHVDF